MCALRVSLTCIRSPQRRELRRLRLPGEMRLGDPESRAQLEAVLTILDGATAEFERLVGMDVRAELFHDLEQLKQGDLRAILLVCVLIEQQRRAARSAKSAASPPEAS